MNVSKAVQRKRKRQQKGMVGSKVPTSISSLNFPVISSSSLTPSEDRDDQSEYDEEEEEGDVAWGRDSIISPDKSQQSMSVRKNQHVIARKKLTPAELSELFAIPNTGTESSKISMKSGDSSFMSLQEQVSKLTLVKILLLRDVLDVTCQEKANLLLSKLIHPMKISEFYQHHWEKEPLLSSHNSESYFGKIITPKSLKGLIEEHVFKIGEDIRLIPSEARAENEYSESAIVGKDIWRKFKSSSDSGSSLTVLHPQKHHIHLWRLLSALEFQFESRVDVAVTIQSPNFCLFGDLEEESFDQFILQLEGSSAWYIVAADGKTGEKASDSKKDASDTRGHSFSLEAGDCLYIPKKRLYRQQSTTKDQQCLFLSLQTNQSRSTADLLRLVVPQAIENLSIESSTFRRALPYNFNAFIGVASSEDDESTRRKLFMSYMESDVFPKVVQQMMEILDPAADQLAKAFILERLPVPLSKEEEEATAASASEATLYPYTQLRILRPGIAAAVIEDGMVVVYHCMDNSRELFGTPNSPLEFDLDDGPAIEALLKAYPEPVMISELDHPSEELDDKIAIAQGLFREGLLVIVDDTSKPHRSAAYKGSELDSGHSSDDNRGESFSLL